MNLTSRQQLILKHIISMYIKNGIPIGSKLISELNDITFSAATIRQEMSLLEQFGLIEKPYNQGGRTPSIEGYQYYTQHLMSQQVSLNNQISQLFSNREKSIDQMLEKAATILSDITNLAAVVIGPNKNQEILKNITFTKLSATVATIVLITGQGSIQSKTFSFDSAKELIELKHLITILNERLVDTPIVDVVVKLNKLKPILLNQIHNLESIFQTFVAEFIQLAKSNVYNSGSTNLIKYQQLSSQNLPKLINLIENHSSIEQFVKGQNKDILIGSDSLSIETAVLKHKYNINGQIGHIALIGPIRMEYDKLNSLLDEVVKEIEEFVK